MPICILCKNEKSKESFKSVEHVLQKSLGGNLTIIDTVCDICNTEKLSGVDQALSDYSEIAYIRLNKDLGMKNSKFSNICKDEYLNENYDVDIDSSNKVSLKSQILLKKDNKIKFITKPELNNDYEKILSSFLDDLKKLGKDKIKILIDDIDEYEPARIVRERKNYFYLRAKNNNDFNILLDIIFPILENSNINIISKKCEEKISPKLTQLITMNRRNINRAVTKCAYEMLFCLLQDNNLNGFDIIKWKELESHRKFILEGELLRQEDYFGHDFCEVTDTKIIPITLEKDNHRISFVLMGDDIVCVIEYFEGSVNYLVKFPKIAKKLLFLLEESSVHFYLFNYVKKEHFYDRDFKYTKNIALKYDKKFKSFFYKSKLQLLAHHIQNSSN